MVPKQYRRLFATTLFLVLLVNSSLLGQDKKVEKLIRKANLNFQSEKFVAAEEMYRGVLESQPSNYTATYRLGLINDYLDDYTEALRWYRRASEIDPDRNDTVYLQIGLSYKKLNNYRLAKESLLEFQKRHETQDEYYKRAQLEIEGCDLAEASARKRPRFLLNPVPFNSEAIDAYPAILDQRQEDVFLVFTSHRKIKGRANKAYQGLGQPARSDLFTSVMENDSTYGPVSNLGKPVNTKKNDGTATFSADGLSMYYTICNNKNNKEGCSIYESRYDPVKKAWSKPTPIPGISGTKEVVINTRGKTKRLPTDDRQPSISRDGRTLYFASDRPGGLGGFDIWYSRRVGLGWSAPINAGTVVNTAFDEYSPFINRDGDKLYFSSDGHGGYGGFDVYVSEGTVGEWSAPENIKSPVNSSYDDISSIWMDEDSLVIFSSNRPGGVGSYDIYWARRQYYAPGSFDITVQGLVRDKRTLQPIPFATAILYQYQPTGAIIAVDTFETDQTARYNFELIEDQNYKILGNAPEYLANEVEVSTVGIEDDTEIERNIDIELEPIVIGLPIVLQNIYYDFDEFYLRPDALLELNNLLKVLRQNSNITIQLGSHTDSNGGIQYNEVLSDNRARAAVKYLVDNGIDPQRVYWYGYGESQPIIYPELTDEDEQANRRTEFRILSIEFAEQ